MCGVWRVVFVALFVGVSAGGASAGEPGGKKIVDGFAHDNGRAESGRVNGSSPYSFEKFSKKLSETMTATGKTAVARELSYVLSGVIEIEADDHAVKAMVLGLSAVVTVHEDGHVSGDGRVIYLSMEGCQWQPPYSAGTPAPWCRVEDVVDGSFLVTGNVIETLAAADKAHALHAPLFELANKSAGVHQAGAQASFAPLRLQLNLVPTGLPKERLAMWGFAALPIDYRIETAATRGMMAAGLFNKPFEIMPIAANRLVAGLDRKNVHVFGSRDAGVPVQASGRVAFVDATPAVLPLATNELVYAGQWVEALPSRPFLKAEMEAMEARRSWAVADAPVMADAAVSSDAQVVKGKGSLGQVAGLDKEGAGEEGAGEKVGGAEASANASGRLDSLVAVYKLLDMQTPVAMAPRRELTDDVVKLTEVIEPQPAE